jgi:hypothetical protein
MLSLYAVAAPAASVASAIETRRMTRSVHHHSSERIERIAPAAVMS